MMNKIGCGKIYKCLLIKRNIKKLIIYFNRSANSPIIKINNRKVIFIHINKTGGTSIAHLIGLPHKMHLSAQEIINIIGKKEWESAFKFAVVRNPWDKVVSHYKYRVLTNQTEMNTNPISFKNWIKCTYGVEKDNFYYDNPKMFQTQVDWLKDDQNKICIDRILKFENLKSDFKEVANIIGVNKQLPHLNQTIKTNYKEYYDEETMEIVSNWFSEDIKLFGYTFNDNND